MEDYYARLLTAEDEHFLIKRRCLKRKDRELFENDDIQKKSVVAAACSGYLKSVAEISGRVSLESLQLWIAGEEICTC